MTKLMVFANNVAVKRINTKRNGLQLFFFHQLTFQESSDNIITCVIMFFLAKKCILYFANARCENEHKKRTKSLQKKIDEKNPETFFNFSKY